MRTNLVLLLATDCATSWCSGEFWDLSHFQTARQSVKMSVFINYIYMNTRQLTLPMISLGCPCVILPTLDSTTSVVYNHRLIVAVIVVSTWIKTGKLLIIEYMLSTILSIILNGYGNAAHLHLLCNICSWSDLRPYVIYKGSALKLNVKLFGCR